MIYRYLSVGVIERGRKEGEREGGSLDLRGPKMADCGARSVSVSELSPGMKDSAKPSREHRACCSSEGSVVMQHSNYIITFFLTHFFLFLNAPGLGSIKGSIFNVFRFKNGVVTYVLKIILQNFVLNKESTIIAHQLMCASLTANMPEVTTDNMFSDSV